MAVPTTLSFGAGVFYISDSGSPDTFIKVCGFNSASIEVTKDTNDTTVPDCDDPDAASWTERDVLALGWTMNFEGVLAVESLDLLDIATFRSDPTSVRLILAGAGTGGGTPNKMYSGQAHVRHSKTGQRGSKWTVSVTVEGDGELLIENVA